MELPAKLKARLARYGELDQTQKLSPALTLEEFFEGNSDEGSIGCNLSPHPGIELFRQTFEAIADRSDVLEVLFPVTEFLAELDWPFVDNVLVVTTATPELILDACGKLEPSESWVLDPKEYPRFDGLRVPLGAHVVNLWWD